MKKCILFLLLVPATASLFGQDLEIPKTEFTFQSSGHHVDITRGKSGTIDLQIIRSKAFQKSSATLEIGSPLPPGVSIQYDPDKGVLDKSTVVISAKDEAKPGAYQVVLNCTIRNKTKGILIKITIV